jgi:hypothetical protein
MQLKRNLGHFKNCPFDWGTMRRTLTIISKKLTSFPVKFYVTMIISLGVGTEAISACEVAYCAIDLNFANQRYYGCETFLNCIKISRASDKWERSQDDHYTLFTSDTPAITDLGISIEPEAENYLRYSRDLTKAVWSKVNVAATLTATGVDAVAGSATTLLAIDSNATVSQSIQLASGQRNLSVFLRRRTGKGAVSISYDGGTKWMPCKLSQNFTRCSTGIDNLIDPRVSIRIDTAGDAIDVDFVQLEGQRWPTSPILTRDQAPIKRNADIVSIVGNAVTPLNSGAFSMIVEGGGAAPRNLMKERVEIVGSNIASFYIRPHLGKLIQMHHDKMADDLYANLGWGSSPLLSQGSMAKHFKFGASSDKESGISLVADGGPVARHATGYDPGTYSWYLGGPKAEYSGFIRRVTIWNTKLDDHTLQSLSMLDIPAAAITDSQSNWENLSVRSRVKLNNVVYEVHSGISKEPITGTYPTQLGRLGNYVKFNLFANNNWAIDSSDPTFGSDRVELSGNPKDSIGRFIGHDSDPIWIADSFYIEEGDPITTDWCMLGQIHDRSGIGPVVGFLLRSGEFLSVDITFANVAGEVSSKSLGNYPIARGHWYNRVFSVKFNQNGDGYLKVWINGVKIVDYEGIIGNPNTLYYYWKFGIYRSSAPEYMAVRYSNVRIKFDDLSSQIAMPDPSPLGYCSDDGSC